MKITFLVSTCVGMGNIDYQCRERFLSLWTFVYTVILKIYHMVWGVGFYMYVCVHAHSVFHEHIGYCFGEVVITGSGSHLVFVSF